MNCTNCSNKHLSPLMSNNKVEKNEKAKAWLGQASSKLYIYCRYGDGYTVILRIAGTMPDLDPVKTFMETTFLQCVLKVSNIVRLCTLFIFIYYYSLFTYTCTCRCASRVTWNCLNTAMFNFSNCRDTMNLTLFYGCKSRRHV